MWHTILICCSSSAVWDEQKGKFDLAFGQRVSPFNIVKIQGLPALGYDWALAHGCDANYQSGFLPQVQNRTLLLRTASRDLSHPLLQELKPECDVLSRVQARACVLVFSAQLVRRCLYSTLSW